MKRFGAAPTDVFLCAWRNKSLLWQLIVREIAGRYRGSLMGLLWSFLNPTLMLLVYTFVFGVVLRARWPQSDRLTTVDFSVVIFAALIVHGLFSECITRAPGLIVGNSNFVKKVVFPLELLPWTTLAAALFHALVSVLVLLMALLLLNRYISWTAAFLPIVLVPLLLMTVGVSWFLAGLGVFVRDIGQVIGIVSTALLFMSPAFFPIEQVPKGLQLLVRLNPLTLPINQARQVLIWGTIPDWSALGLWFAISFLICWLGFWWFQRARVGFADVL